MPDGNLFRFPGFDRAYGYCLSRNHRNITAAGCPGILCNREWMQLDDTRCEFTIFSRRWRIIFVCSFAFWRIIECPVFNITLSALHDRTPDAIPTFYKAADVSFWKVKIFIRHNKLFSDAIEAQMAVSFFE